MGRVRNGIPADTTEEAFDRQVDRWRVMTIAERAELIDGLSRDLTEITRAGIEAASPGLDETAFLRELARRRYGDELAEAAYPTASS